MIRLPENALHTIVRVASYTGLIFSTGFAMFAMFFGSGNLVFPLLIGKAVGANYGAAIIGLMITGVFLPFLGLLAILLFNGSYKRFFGRFDRVSAFVIPLIILSLIGPFAVIPRCITVAYGSFTMLTDSVGLPLFSLIMCVALFLATLDHKKLIPLLGNILTPFLLAALVLIIYFGVANSAEITYETNTLAALSTGIIEGYQTMDLLAAFFFASTVVFYMKKKLQKGKDADEPVKKRIILACLIIGAGFLGIIYGFFVYMGAAYAPLLEAVPAEKSLAIITHETLGIYGGPVVCTAVILACFTTAIVLTSVTTEFFQEKVFRNKISLGATTILTLGISFLVSNLEFSGIAVVLKPILEAIYPAIITFTFLNIAFKLWDFKPLKRPVYIVFALTLFLMFWMG